MLPQPYGGTRTLWQDALPHLCLRLEWSEPSFSGVSFVAEDELSGDEGDLSPQCRLALDTADMVVCVAISDEPTAERVARASAECPCVVAFDCAAPLLRAARLHFQPASVLLAALQSALPWSRANRDALLLESAHELVARNLPSDFVFALLMLLDAAVAPVRTFSVNKQTTLRNVACMVRNCGREVVACVTDPQCKAALDCLTECGLNDQVCSYRCIVSYETPLFEQFSLCNLQKHNCLDNHAERPQLPAISPMRKFRGEALTHETAESLLVGWLDVHDNSLVTGVDNARTPWSWQVVAGQNPAFDYFPCQNQIFYRATKGGRAFWYDPVFKVQSLSGGWEWRRRHYRVKRGTEPGRFVFSVLDNGVTSLEHWAIVDVADDLSWGLFAYSGAAAAAGQAYGGAVFVTKTGHWPSAEHLPRVEAAHHACGIQMWETYTVDNSPELCRGAPLQMTA